MHYHAVLVHNFLLQDCYAFGRFTPVIDHEQNWFLISGEEENGTTILQFWRNFTSCDDYDMDVTVINTILYDSNLCYNDTYKCSFVRICIATILCLNFCNCSLGQLVY